MDFPSGVYRSGFYRGTLRWAAVYNLVWGAWVVLFPGHFFAWTGMAPPDPVTLAIWQCVGMIVGVYGVGYGVASLDPYRYWPVVGVGLLGKILGPIGFLKAVAEGVFPPAFGWVIVFNDLLWWIPFGLILHGVFDHWRLERTPAGEPLYPERPWEEVAREAKTQFGETLDALQRRTPVLLVFLRHRGCTFCRETLGELSKKRADLEKAGIQPVLVHMSSDADAALFFESYGLGDLPRISDGERHLYRGFQLKRGTLGQLFGWRSWVRGVDAGIFKGHGVGPLAGDGFQMSGVFLIHNGKIVVARPHQVASEATDFGSFCGVAAP